MNKNNITFWKKKVEEELKNIFSVSSSRRSVPLTRQSVPLTRRSVLLTLEEAMQYSLFPPGKMYRPICLIASFYANIKNNSFELKEEVVLSAAAVELIHTYSLVHDDLPYCDASDWRRGKLACHKKFSTTLALLAGDALLTLAFHTISRIKYARLVKIIIRELTEAIGYKGMLLGQTLDLTLNQSIGKDTLKYVHLHKTAKLIAVCLRIGGILANANKEKLDILEKLGINLGLAFQISDDLKDKGEKGLNCLKLIPDILYWEKQKDNLLKEAKKIIKDNYSQRKAKYLYYLVDVLREDKLTL